MDEDDSFLKWAEEAIQTGLDVKEVFEFPEPMEYVPPKPFYIIGSPDPDSLSSRVPEGKLTIDRLNMEGGLSPLQKILAQGHYHVSGTTMPIHNVYEPGGEVTQVPSISNTDRIMVEFERILRSPPKNLNVKWHYKDGSILELKIPSRSQRNDPDMWAGFAAVAYHEELIDKSQLTDILLALQGAGAKSDHFKAMIKQLLSNEL